MMEAFPPFELLKQYEPKDAIELGERNKFPLLILENYFLPFFLDWAISENETKLLQLLFEYDKFRFVQSHNLRIKDLIESLHLTEDCSPYLMAVMDLHAHNIEMPASLASVCNYSWDLFLTRAQKIHHSSVWSSFTKKIIEGYDVDFNFVITDDHYSGYFKQYLLQVPGDAESLSCWRDIRHVLSTLQILKKPSLETAKRPSFSQNSSSTNRSSNTQSNIVTYLQPYEPLSILLECLRKYYTILVRGTCNAISKATKIRLTDLYQQTNTIRNVKMLDLNFAIDYCESIEALLTILMDECYQYLQERYAHYLKSNEYVSAVASIRLRKSDIVQLYLRKNVFLAEIANGKRFARRLTGNILFTSYPFTSSGMPSKYLPLKLPLLSYQTQSKSSEICDNPIIPCLIIRTDYRLLMSGISSENYLLPALEETRCWVMNHIPQPSDQTPLTLHLAHKIIYPDNFTALSSSPIIKAKLKVEKKKKKVTFQLDEDLSENLHHENGDKPNSSLKTRPLELTSLDRLVIQLMNECQNDCINSSSFPHNHSFDPEDENIKTFVIHTPEMCKLFHEIGCSLNSLSELENIPFPTNIYISTSHTKEYKSPDGDDMKSIVYVLSPLPMIDTIQHLCTFMKDITLPTSEDDNSNTHNSNSQDNNIKPLHVHLTSFQKEILRFNYESIRYLHFEPFHREKLVEYYVNPNKETTISSKSGYFHCDFNFLELFQQISFNLFLTIAIRVISHQSVVIHSIDSYLITKIIAAIESLLHPMEMIDYHSCQYNLSTIEDFRDWKYNYLIHHDCPFLMGLPSTIALSIIKLQMNTEQSDACLLDTMSLDVSYGKYLRETNFNDLQVLDLHDVIFIDLDSEKIWSTWNPQGSISLDSTLSIIKNETLNQIISIIQQITIPSSPTVAEEAATTTTRYDDYSSSNSMIEDCMKYLWNELYLQYIPSSLYHYPQYNVISCNIKMILEHCSSSSSSTSVAAAGASSISPSSSSNNIFQVVYQSDTIHRKKLDFLESIIDSKGFELLIQRHGLALDYWSKKVT